jgi:hypothetical protein
MFIGKGVSEKLDSKKEQNRETQTTLVAAARWLTQSGTSLSNAIFRPAGRRKQNNTEHKQQPTERSQQRQKALQRQGTGGCGLIC